MRAWVGGLGTERLNIAFLYWRDEIESQCLQPAVRRSQGAVNKVKRLRIHSQCHPTREEQANCAAKERGGSVESDFQCVFLQGEASPAPLAWSSWVAQ